MHAGHVAVKCIPLNGTVVAQRTSVGLLTQLPQQMGLEFAFAGKELLAVRTLEAWVWKVEMQVLYQMGPLLKAAFAFWAHVCLEEGLSTGSHMPLPSLLYTDKQKDQQGCCERKSLKMSVQKKGKVPQPSKSWLSKLKIIESW